MELAGTWKLAQDLILPRFTVIYLYSSSLWKWAPVLPTWPDHTLAAQHCSSSLIFVSYVKMHISRDLCIKSNLLCNSSKILRKPTFWLQKPPCSELPFPYYTGSPACQTTLPPSPPAHRPTRPAASGQPTNQAGPACSPSLPANLPSMPTSLAYWPAQPAHSLQPRRRWTL